jgi:hypothetical protein
MSKLLVGVATAFAVLLLVYVTTGRGGGVDVDGPVVAHDAGWGLAGASGMDALVGGALEHEGDCVHLSGDAVIWPDGTTWDEGQGAVRLDDGRLVRVGESVTGGGGMAAEGRDRARWDRTQTGQVLADCVGPGKAVVVFNADADLEVGAPPPG